MLLRLLGAVEIAGETGWTRAGPAKRSCVLAVLAMTPGTAVPLETLAERLWGADMPSSGYSTLYGHIAHLRTALGKCPGEVAIRRVGHDGYLLDVDPRLIDVHAMRSLAARARELAARGETARALAAWRHACDLMRTEALAGIKGDWAASVRAGVRREHVTMLAERYAVELETGRHTEIVEELSTHVARHPLSEGLVECLMVALYRSGRQAEALACYADARGRWVERLGADPGRRLQDVHLAILHQEPIPERTTSPPEPTAVRGELAQLPAAPRHFAGRAAELAELDRELADPDGCRLWTIGGPGGIGKSWLALHWARLRRGEFRDGQLYVNLHGFDPRVAPSSPEVALRGLLEALGVAPSAVPTDLDAMSGLYRGLLAGKRVLIVLDDVRDSGQVIPLLPGDDVSVTVITGRAPLTTLAASHGARALRLASLDHDDSREALTRRIGPERMSAEPGAADRLLDTCAGLPLALGILAARAAARPGLPLATLAASTCDESARLDALDTGEVSGGLRAVLDGSLAAVSAAAARLFVLLGLIPGADADRHAIASLAGVTVGEADALLRELDTGHLIDQHAPDRYRMHDLTRLYASERARAQCDAAERTAALARVVDHYVHTGFAGRRVMQRGLIPRDFGEPATGCVVRPLPDLEAAKRWFADESANLGAVQRTAAGLGWDASVWRLAWGVGTFHIQRRRSREGLSMWRRAAEAAKRAGWLSDQAAAEHFLCQLSSYDGDEEAAVAHARRGLELAEAAADVLQLAGAHDALGKSYLRLGEPRRALRHSTRSLEYARRSGNRTLQAQGLNSVGWHRAHLGEHESARASCTEALTMARDIRDDYLAALILDSLGFIAARDDRFDDALVHYGESLELLRRYGVHEQEPNVVASMAEAHEALGQRREAERLRREAAEQYESQGYVRQARRLRAFGVEVDRTA